MIWLRKEQSIASRCSVETTNYISSASHQMLLHLVGLTLSVLPVLAEPKEIRCLHSPGQSNWRLYANFTE